jgi:hypothetical protein
MLAGQYYLHTRKYFFVFPANGYSRVINSLLKGTLAYAFALPTLNNLL